MFELHVQSVSTYDVRVVVTRNAVRLASGRAGNVPSAVAEAVRMARMAMRLERDERARLALSLAPKLTELAVRATDARLRADLQAQANAARIRGL